MTVEGIMNVPASAEMVARALDRQADFRVLRRMRTIDRRDIPGLRTRVMTGVALDVETTGRDPASDRVIELAMQRFGIDAAGRIVETEAPVGWLEQPGVPIPAEITRITGIRDEDVRGRAIVDGEAVSLILGSDFIVAHNAAFDRPFLERRLPEIVEVPWACSLTDVDWGSHGFEARKLKHLAMEMGWFYEAHRATVDVTALLHVLDHELPDGTTVVSRMLERAREPTYVVEAVDAPFDRKGALSARGWRWNAARRVWAVEVGADRFDAEVEWATIHVYSALRSPEWTRVDWRTRHAG